MKTIALINQKGGSGKTTLAVNLAVAFSAAGQRVLLLDLDPQESTVNWGRRRGAQAPAVRKARESDMTGMFEQARDHGVDMLICDTPGRHEQMAKDLARMADLILIPCAPSIMHVDAMRSTIEMVRLVRRPPAAVLNNVPSFGGRGDAAQTLIENDFGLTVCPARLGHRVVFDDCMNVGQGAQEYEPGGKAAIEVGQVHKWVSGALTR